jgi:two-component system response regulator AtoC
LSSLSPILNTDDIELPEQTTEPPAGGPKDQAMDEFERGYVMELLAEHQGNVSHAARAAGKDRRTFQRLMRKHSIERSAFQTVT